MKNVLLMCAIFPMLGCGPQGSPVSDVSSYTLDYYGYATRRLPIEEKIIDGQCLIKLQPATNAMFADYSNEQDSANAKIKFIGALAACNEKISAFNANLWELERAFSQNVGDWRYKIAAEGTTAKNRAGYKNSRDALNALWKMIDRQETKYSICQNMIRCLGAGNTESDTSRCLEEAATMAERVLPKDYQP